LLGARGLAERERAGQRRTESEEFSACIGARNAPPSEWLSAVVSHQSTRTRPICIQRTAERLAITQKQDLLNFLGSL
jgi:hypothetical protein